MKKILFFTIALIITLFPAFSISAEEEAPADWLPNSPGIAIYHPSVFGEGAYAIEVNGEAAGQVDESEMIRLLMIDGGFVPDPRIIMENNRTLVPIRLISESFGADVIWNGADRTITIKGEGLEILLTVGSDRAVVNGFSIRMETIVSIFDASAYVPLRFIAEGFEGYVDYIPRLTYGVEYTEEDADNPYIARENVSLVIIEFDDEDEKALPVEDCLAVVLEASAEVYGGILNLVEINNNDINSAGKGDYDPEAVEYAGFDIGRYYVFQLKGFEEYPVFFNKFTGEIYGESPALPFVYWTEGFPRLSFMYQ